MGTVIICGVLALIVGLVIYKLVSDKRKGKSSCGGDCAHCKSNCH